MRLWVQPLQLTCFGNEERSPLCKKSLPHLGISRFCNLLVLIPLLSSALRGISFGVLIRLAAVGAILLVIWHQTDNVLFAVTVIRRSLREAPVIIFEVHGFCVILISDKVYGWEKLIVSKLQFQVIAILQFPFPRRTDNRGLLNFTINILESHVNY